MRPSDFHGGSGRLLRTSLGYLAFVPNPLPPKLELTWALARRLSAADRSLAELAGVARNLPNPHLLIKPFMNREAVLSSRIEGTQASLSDLVFFEAGGAVPRQSGSAVASDVREVANYVRAMNEGVARLHELPLSLRFIRELHRTLLHGMRGEHLTPGEFRRSQNWIGPPASSLSDAVFVPPPVSEMNAALDAFERYLHASSDLPELIRLALIHYQFEAIHPFLDGNGRVGRLLISILLCHHQLLPQPLLYLSAFFERRRDDYYRLLLAVSQAGRWLEWIDFFLMGVAEQARDAVRRSTRLLDLRQQYRDQLASARATALPIRLIDVLFERPVITIPNAAQHLDISYRAAGLIVAKLCAAKILDEVNGRRRPRTFVASGILEAIEARLPAQRHPKDT